MGQDGLTAAGITATNGELPTNDNQGGQHHEERNLLDSRKLGQRLSPPVNADEIISAANDMIDKYIEYHHLDLEYIMEFRDAFDYSSMLWENFCKTNEIDGIKAIYEEE